MILALFIVVFIQAHDFSCQKTNTMYEVIKDDLCDFFLVNVIRSSYKRPDPVKSSTLLDQMYCDMQILFRKTALANTGVYICIKYIFKINKKTAVIV